MNNGEFPSVEPLIELLTRRQREILELLAQDYSGPQIARQLTLAPSSVKWYIHELYGKLGVSRRQQALSRAWALGLLQTPPPAATARPASGATPAPRHNLPMELTRFFGRAPEITQIKELLAEYRLVTVTGVGGVGKTRLSLRVAEDVLDDFADGVWLVELAPLSDPALVAQAIAVRLGARENPGQPFLESLTAYLRRRQALLVLDNCEHLLEACAQLVETLLRACPRLAILATSREPLDSEGEAIFPAAPLPFPQAGEPLSLERLAVCPSVRLFANRARMVQPDYQVTPDQLAPLARICAQLEGLPLAIEMAAARMDILTAEQLAGRLDDAFDLLRARRRTALPRQQSLRATLDWSYVLLTEPEQLLLRRLSVFAGGCTLEAAAAVCSDESPVASPRIAPSDIEAMLAALVAKSMVVVDRRPSDETRYRLLEVVRQYGAEKLETTGERVRLRRRQRDYFLDLYEIRVPEREAQAVLDRAEYRPPLEVDNLRRALEWSFSDPTDITAAPRLVLAINKSWPSQQEIMDWYARAVAFAERQLDLPVPLRASLLARAGIAVSMQDAHAGITLGQQAVDLCRGLDPSGKPALLWNLYLLGNQFLANLRDAQGAFAAIAEADGLLHELGPENIWPPLEFRWRMAYRAGLKAELAIQQGLFQDALACAHECLRLNDTNGNHREPFKARRCLAEAYLGLGDLAQARTYFLEALRLRENAQNGTWQIEQASALRGLAIVDFQSGNLDRARGYCLDSLCVAAGVPDPNLVASGLAWAALIEAARSRPLRAATLSGASAALWKRQRRKPLEDSSLDTLLPCWRGQPDQAAITEAYAAGQAMSADEAVAYALNDAA